MTALRVLVICALVASVLGHAVLKTPTPYNANPSKTAPCGLAGTFPTLTSQATWLVGDTVTIVWQMIAGDGNGLVTVVADPNGGTDFSAANAKPITTFNTNDVKTYTQSFVVPDISCAASKDGLCTIQFATATNWFSCTRVNITACPGCPAPPPPAPKCTTATGLAFCVGTNQRNNRAVLIPEGQSPVVIDAELSATFNSYLNNTNVFTNGKDATCRTDYKTFLCNSQLPLCPGSGEAYSQVSACRAQCRQTMKECQLTELHAALYDCDSLRLCAGESPASSLHIMPLVFLSALVLALLF